MKYTRKSLIDDLSKILKDLKPEQKRETFNYYSFNIDNNKRLTGYPIAPKDNSENLDIPQGKKESIENIITNFITNNKIFLPKENKGLEEDLNKIVQALPEFLTSVGKIQHYTQKYTLDMHQLKDLKEFITHPKYKKLDKNDQKIGKLAILIHDIAKKEGIPDEAHHINSAIDAYSIIKKLNLPSFEHDRVIGLIRNHHWSEELSEAKKSSKDYIAKDIAFRFRKPEDFEISKIFAEADLKAINDTFYDEYKNNLKDNIKKIQPLVDKIQSTGIWLPRTSLNTSKNIKYVSGVEGVNGPLKVIDINSFNEFYGIIHAIDENNFTKEKAEVINNISDEDSKSVLSNSFITKNNFNTIDNLKYGFIFNADPSNLISI